MEKTSDKAGIVLFRIFNKDISNKRHVFKDVFILPNIYLNLFRFMAYLLYTEWKKESIIGFRYVEKIKVGKVGFTENSSAAKQYNLIQAIFYAGKFKLSWINTMHVTGINK
jgi:hypothetical protein